MYIDLSNKTLLLDFQRSFVYICIAANIHADQSESFPFLQGMENK
jgi:hypothetical protein